MEDANELNIEFHKLLNEIEEFTNNLASAEKLDYKEPKWKWRGGIGELIQDSIHTKKLEKYYSRVVYNGMTFDDIRKSILSYSEKLTQLQSRIQSATTKDDPVYYGNIKCIQLYITNLANAWIDICPDLANAEMHDSSIGYYTMNMHTQHFVEEDLKTLDLPNNVSKQMSNDGNEGSGCLGVLVFLIGLAGFVGYEVYNYFA